MFKNHFLKLLVAVCICLTSIVCSYGQGGGIIDVVIQARTAEVHELKLDTYGNQVKVSLITSDGIVYLQKTMSDGVIDNLPSGTYQLTVEDLNGHRQSYFLRLED